MKHLAALHRVRSLLATKATVETRVHLRNLMGRHINYGLLTEDELIKEEKHRYNIEDK